MAKQEANEAFALTSFLYGTNAGWIEDQYARYQQNPEQVDAGWRAFFEALRDDRETVIKEARGASWKRTDWPIPMNGELVSALDSNWMPLEKEIGEKIQAKPIACAGIWPPISTRWA